MKVITVANSTSPFLVLLVDDDAVEIELISEYLSHSPSHIYRVTAASSYEEALALLNDSKNKFDIALVDYYLGPHNGLDLLKDLNRVQVPTIILTGNGNLKIDRLALRLGAADYLPKDKIDGELLDLSIRHAIDRKKNELLVIRQQRDLDEVIHKTALSELAATIIHEINNPLSVIQSKLMQIQQLLDAPEFNKELAATSTDAALKMIYRIIKIKDSVKRLHAGKENTETQRAFVIDIVNDAVGITERHIQQSGVKIEVEIANDLELFCRPIEVSQMLINLICNSCDALAGQPHQLIQIHAKEAGEDVLMSVADSGQTPDENIRNEMFNQYFSTKEGGKGMGIGLNLVKRIVTGHGGSIEIDPDSQNTCFLIRFPKLGLSLDSNATTTG